MRRCSIQQILSGNCSFITKTSTPFNVVLDIDQTLLMSNEWWKDDFGKKLLDLGLFKNGNEKDQAIARRIYRRGEHWTTLRPYLREFINFCFQYFARRIVFSAGTREYVHSMCELIFYGSQKPDRIFSREDMDVDSRGKTVYQKCIASIARMNEPSVRFDNTLFIDDNPDYLVCNPKNCIYIPPFAVTPSREGLGQDDTTLLQIMQWLEANGSAKSVYELTKLFYKT